MIGDFLTTHSFNLIQILLVTVGYLMPLPLAFIAFHLWHHYRTERFIMGMKWVLLEILVPREVVKSPAAMELVFINAFYHQSIKSFWEQYIIGAPVFWFSLEMVSIDGRVHFYVRTPSRLKNLVETQIYAQYPQAKVIEVEDYVFKIPQYTQTGEWDIWGCEFTKLKEDFLPIRTYKGFGEDMKTGIEEEYKIDPITPTIEYLGSVPKGQQVWIQIVIRENAKKYHSHKTGKSANFVEGANEYIENILAPYTRVHKNEQVPGTFGKQVGLPKHLEPIIQSITDQLGLVHFDCGIRVLSLSNKKECTVDQFNNLRRDIRLLFRQYAQPFSNEFNRINGTIIGAVWADPTGLGTTKLKRRALNFYRLRTFFHPPIQYSYKYPVPLSFFFPTNNPQIFVLSVEELATIFHFPGMVSETPSFKRIESKIAKPPSNLPI